MAVEWHDANKSFVVYNVNFDLWSVYLLETFLTGNIYQAQNYTFKQKKCKMC